MSKNFEQPASLPNGQSQIQEDGDYSTPGISSSNRASLFKAPITPFPNAQQLQQNGPTSGTDRPNGSPQFSMPFTLQPNVPPGEQLEQARHYSMPGIPSSSGTSLFKAPTTSFLNATRIQQNDSTSDTYQPNGSPLNLVCLSHPHPMCHQMNDQGKPDTTQCLGYLLPMGHHYSKYQQPLLLVYPRSFSQHSTSRR